MEDDRTRLYRELVEERKKTTALSTLVQDLVRLGEKYPRWDFVDEAAELEKLKTRAKTLGVQV